MYLDRIQVKDYRTFVKDLFSKVIKHIEDDLISKVFVWTRLHTIYKRFEISNLELITDLEKIISMKQSYL